MDRRKFMGRMTAITAVGTAGLQLGFTESSKIASDGIDESQLFFTEIPKRILGKTGVEVSCLALGGVTGMQLKPTPEFHPAELANAALDAGITYFDTSPSYAGGQSELNFGEVLVKRRNEVFLATKTGERTYDGTMRSVEASLKRLQTDHVDLLQVHGVYYNEDFTMWSKPEGMMKALYKLRDEKVTRFVGVTGHEDAEAMNRAIDRYEFDTILTTFNPVPRRKPFRESVLPNAVRKKMGIICMKVMGGGLGALVTGNPPELAKGAYWYLDVTPYQADASTLIRYALGLPVSCAVVGMKSLKDLEINVAAAKKKPLTKEEQFNLEKRMW
jgi:uncharacterized protein